MELDHILISGAEEHNLQSIRVKIPKKKLVVFTGVSGSGKSSLAFDTLYAEGQRRYVESLSAYARQFLGRLDKPQYDAMKGLAPTISIEQKTAGSNPRSTVGTITEIADYFRLLYARVGQQLCLQCGKKVKGQSAQQIALELTLLPANSRVVLLAPQLKNRKGEHRELIAETKRKGFVRLRLNGEIVDSEELEALDKRKKNDLEIVIDRLVIGQTPQSRLNESCEKALDEGKGELIAMVSRGGGKSYDKLFSRSAACCGQSYPELTPQSFSFNSPQGMCTDCAGLGTQLAMDPHRVVPDPSLTIDEGAVAPWGINISKKTKGWGNGTRYQILRHLAVPFDIPFSKLKKKVREAILYGTGEKRYPVTWESKTGGGQFNVRWEGVLPRLMRRLSESQSERAKKSHSQYLGTGVCRSCNGTRLRRESRAVMVQGKSIDELSALTVSNALAFFKSLRLNQNQQKIAAEILKEVNSHLGFLERVGLSYLALDRPGPSLSGGESQRIRLASQVGSELTGVIYVLDEPSIGLHQRDNDRLIQTLEGMRDIGNTVVVVEHDEDTIRAADHVVDFGPGAGVEGGELIFSGTPQALEKCTKSETGAYLSGRKSITLPPQRRNFKQTLTIEGASANNLKKIDVTIPLGVFTAVTGVSGAGKSTLINEILFPALAHQLHGGSHTIGEHKRIHGLEQLNKVIDIDQKPIGRTPRSNPATYVKVFDDIRKLFAEIPEAKARGYSPSRFSFNMKGGRCEACQGDGVRKVEMHFFGRCLCDL
ncbi:MAG: excinuclease ABC subunit UvrA [Polyangiaceae bacterium]|nr:excinuclease ABC subunit UvrA [Polyangiaceae bacterium]